MALPPQPTLPSGEVSDAELDFIDSTPPGVFPENQNSNFGFKRKIWAGFLQELIDQITTIYNEGVVDTASIYLDEWEYQYGLPQNPSTLDIPGRRARVLSRIHRGPFTRTRRKNVIEPYLTATFGTPIMLTPAGVAMDAAGIPLYTEAGSLDTVYSIWENTSPGINLITNGSFETDTSGWAAAAGSTLTRDTGTSKFGTASLKVTPSATNLSGASYTITLTNGTVYTLSCWAFIPVGTTLRLSTNAQASGNYVGTGAWQFMTFTFTAGASDGNIVAIQKVGATTAAFWADGVMFETGSVAHNFTAPSLNPFYYEVRIKSTLTPDLVGLTRDLTWLTPAGISFAILSVTTP